ncbi:MAG: hypothetical protein Q7U60_06660 [Candidatus Methanoperedens sp.]|nr:hypothetical protein [Candidatus Methanoperedens sp.]
MTNSTDIIFVQTLGCYVMIEYTSGLRSISFVKSKDKIKEKKTLDITFELERYFKGEKIDLSVDT